MSTEPGSAPEPPLLVLWLSFCSSVATLGIVAMFIEPAAASPEIGVMSPVFALIALALGGATVLLRPLLARSGPYATYCFIRWAMCEAIGILGFGLFFLGGEAVVFAGFIFFSGLMFLVNAPLGYDRQWWRSMRHKD